jgi:hypothetical protein
MKKYENLIGFLFFFTLWLIGVVSSLLLAVIGIQTGWLASMGILINTVGLLLFLDRLLNQLRGK